MHWYIICVVNPFICNALPSANKIVWHWTEKNKKSSRIVQGWIQRDLVEGETGGGCTGLKFFGSRTRGNLLL